MEELKAALKEALDPLGTQIKGIEDRLQKIEKLPAIERSFNINSIPSEYKGRKLARQGAFIRKAVAADPASFAVLKDEGKVNEFCKLLIDLVTKTTLAEGTGSYGGYMVPDEFQMDLIQLARSTSFALNVCRIMPMASDQLYIPKELTMGTITWESEGATKTASEPTFDQVSLTAKKMFALAAANNELLQDSSIDIASILTEQFAYSMGQELDNQAFNGTGDPVSGVLTAKAGYSVVLGGAAFSAITASDLSLAISKLSEGRLAQARFFVNRLANHYIRSLKDSNDRPIYAEVGGTVPRTVYEFPINVSEKIAITDGSDKAVGVFGNFQYLILGRRLGTMALEADPYSLFNAYQTRFRMVSRWAFGYGDANSFVRILTA